MNRLRKAFFTARSKSTESVEIYNRHPYGNHSLDISRSQAELLRHVPEITTSGTTHPDSNPDTLLYSSQKPLAIKTNASYLCPPGMTTLSRSAPSSPNEVSLQPVPSPLPSPLNSPNYPLPSPLIPQPSSGLSATSTVSPYQFSQLAQSGRRHPNSSEFVEDYIRRAIEHHEKGELEKATELFRIAAEKSSPLGMFLYGISLRHGWGCHSNQVVAFQFLQKAAESAVFDLSNMTPENPVIAQGELVLAIYELGICFRHGWGVPKNKVTAAYYFEIAATLGDPDAQAELAFCYAHGIGIKKDRYKAAKYYKLAHAQGISVFGNSWIFKEKYVNC
ncbi:hypothetical protein K7432_004351 [Basidiobolus ranarum]|uniref:HCP-like protein n=1 Tax=Basidiobolus ranarum TaxID=34480 RepID=A0ABR2W5N5_9FUNG